jgi:amidase
MFTKSATELAAMIRAKEISSRELLDGYFARIEALNPTINAVVTLDVERAQASATAADEATARDELFGPLHGLPITIKDAIATEGIRSTGGAIELSSHVPEKDAPAVARLKAAGAIVFGKTNLPRWSSDIQTFNDVFGQTNNPWDLERTPGGSSGGAAAAVAAGLTSFELGTDIAGSVRVPAHFNGVFGLKPSYGVIPQRGYLDHPGGGTIDADINVFGPLARSADDLDLLLDVLAGPPPEQERAWRVELPAVRDKRQRVGVWFDEPSCPIESEYRSILLSVADQLAEAGVEIEEAHPPVDFSEQVRVFSQLVLSAMSLSHPTEIADAMAGSHAQWLRNSIRRAELSELWERWFETYDILLCPVTLGAAFVHDHTDYASRPLSIDGVQRSYFQTTFWTGLIGLVGLPSAVAPIGLNSEGLPVGVQCVARHLGDREAIAFARRLGSYLVPPGC